VARDGLEPPPPAFSGLRSSFCLIELRPGGVQMESTTDIRLRFSRHAHLRHVDSRHAPTAAEDCERSSTVDAACRMCGGRAEKMHQPVFHRGSFCPRCCPICSSKTAAAAPKISASTLGRHPGVVASQRTERPPGRGASQWKHLGWGPRSDAPCYRDDRWSNRRPVWVAPPNWFR
jgi:hypothetical protein